MSAPYIDSLDTEQKVNNKSIGPGRDARRRAGAGPHPRIDRFLSTAYIATMALRDILILPDKRLRQVSEPVKKIDAGIRKLIEDMFETMYDAPGIGLAAIQIGTPKRVVTVGSRQEGGAEEPAGLHQSGRCFGLRRKRRSTRRAACRSRNTTATWSAPAQVKVKYLDLEGQPREIEADGLLATCLQHEIDHLNGVLFIDHLSKLKRDRVLKKFTKAAKRAAE